MASAAIYLTLRGRAFPASSPGASPAVPFAPSAERGIFPSTSVSALGGNAMRHEDADSLIGRTLLTAQKSAEEVERTAQVRANATVAEAEAVADNILRSAHDEASGILQNARGEADQIVGTAKEKATAWLTLLQAEADRMVLHIKLVQSGLERWATEWAAGSQDGNPEASPQSERGHTPAIDQRGVDLARSFPSGDGASDARRDGLAVAAATKNGHI
jgi:hypothetical protein